ncbi:MAG: glycine cleavage system aminomethyltransferase GcvT [Candidatus Dormibacteria bacterium]
MTLRTPLHDRHRVAGARMVEFGGYDMPLQYSGIRHEHMAVRERAGVFDLSHMGEVRITGRGAEQGLQRLVAGDVERLRPGQAQYAVMCNEGGGIVDDVVVYRDESGFMVVVNAACRDKDVAWMMAHAHEEFEVRDESDSVALIAVQGPQALAVVQPLTPVDLDGIRPFCFIDGVVRDQKTRISRTGYTGEDGLELYLDASGAGPLWDALLDSGREAEVLPVGLGARDTLRLEAGLRLYGQDMDESTDPFSCGLGWTVRRSKGFLGAEALATLDRQNPPRRFAGLALPGRAIPRHGHAVSAAGRPGGRVTSGGFSFTLGHGIATALLDPQAVGASLTVKIRDMEVPAQTTDLPFYRRPATGARARA